MSPRKRGPGGARFALASALALALPACAPTRADTSAQTPKPPLPAVRIDDVQRELSVLADDSMEGRGTGTRGSARAGRYLASVMGQIGLRPAGDEGYYQHVTGSRRPTSADPLALVNVVGILPGSDPALRGDAVLVDAHYDHLGIGAPVNGDSIYNGADDDASGAVAVLEVARALAAGPRPRRTVVFLETTGEEVGLVGTRWYLAHPAFPLERTVANLEIEMIGRPDPRAGGRGSAWLTGFERTTMGESFRAAGLAIVADPRPEEHFFERSDNIAFARRGIPAQTLSTFGLHPDYHRPSDELRTIDFEHMTAVIGNAARAVRLLADGPAPAWRRHGRPSAEER